VAVEDANLAIDRPRRASVAVAIEGNSLHEVLVAVLEDGLEARTVVGCWRICQKRSRFRHGGGGRWRLWFGIVLMRSTVCGGSIDVADGGLEPRIRGAVPGFQGGLQH
jgi:hypothetical protein